MVLYEHLEICDSCNGSGNGAEPEIHCEHCQGEGVVTPDRRLNMNDSYLECGRCGRKLVDAKSRERGYGPVCWEKVQAEKEEDEE